MRVLKAVASFNGSSHKVILPHTALIARIFYLISFIIIPIPSKPKSRENRIKCIYSFVIYSDRPMQIALPQSDHS